MTSVSRNTDSAAVSRERLTLAVLVGIILIQFAVAKSLHRSENELWSTWAEGSSLERAAAFHILANRDLPPDFGEDFALQMVRSDRPLIRELAMTTYVTRFTGDAIQKASLKKPMNKRQRQRSKFVLTKKEGHRKVILLRSEIRQYLRAGGGRQIE